MGKRTATVARANIRQRPDGRFEARVYLSENNGKRETPLAVRLQPGGGRACAHAGRK